jgi:hypothetical protein
MPADQKTNFRSVFICVICGDFFFGESMKKLFLGFALFASFAVNLSAQNLTTVSGSNITDINGSKLAAGQVCFLITDQQDNPISVSIGGGGQALKRGYCSAVTAGVIAGFTVPNPANTAPAGIYYRISVKDSSTGQEVLRYSQVSFTGATFTFDNYAPLNQGNFAALTGNAVTGNLSVTGNVAATGTVTGSNIPGTIPGTGACTNQFVTSLNTGAPPTCSSTLAVPSSTAAFLIAAPPSYIDGSSQTGGTGGMVQFTNDASTVTGYSAWLTNNAFWNGTNWIQPRGVGTGSTGLAASFHKNFSFNHAGAGGTNNAAFTWTEWANLGAGGFNLETGTYQINGIQIAASNLSNGVSGTGSLCMTTNCAMTTTTIGKLNNAFILDGTKYAQNNTGLHSAAADCITQLGGAIVIPSGVTVSLTSQLILGNNTTKPPCELRIENGGSLSVGTLGAGVDAIQAGDSSGVVCEGWGAGAGAFGATTQCIQFGATSTFNALIAPLDRTGTQEAYYVIGAKILGNCSATVGSSIFDIQGVFAGTRILHFYTSNIPGKVARIRPGTSVLKIASDIVIDGNLDATGCAGGLPLSIEGAAASEISGITLRGQAQHPGAGLPTIKIDGAGVAGGVGVNSIHFEGAYHVESINTPATCQVSIADSAHVAFDQLEASGPAATSLVCISQTLANATHDIEIKHIRTAVSWTNVINNSISSFTSGSDMEAYYFGGGTAGAGGKGLLVYDTLPIQIGTEPISAAPRMLWSPYEQSAVATGTLASFIPDKAITVTRIDVSWINATANCTVAPQITVTDGSNPVTLSVSNATVQQTATFSQNYAAGVRLNLNTVAGTCTTQPSVTNIAVEYKMQ